MSPKTRAEWASAVDAIDLPVERSILDRDDLLIAREGKFSVYYAPFDFVNAEAKVILLGLTPGWQQMKYAIDTYGAARSEGQSVDQSQRSAKDSASFTGMRKRIVTWLDSIGLQHRLELISTAQLFEDRSLLHTTSLVRYPAFVGAKYANYGGHSPRLESSALLREIIEDLVVPELTSLPGALIVPMGTAVSRSLIDLKIASVDRCLVGFPHPSGANGHGPKQFKANESAMTAKVGNWAFS